MQKQSKFYSSKCTLYVLALLNPQCLVEPYRNSFNKLIISPPPPPLGYIMEGMDGRHR